METAMSVAQQVCIMLIIILIGYTIYKVKMIDEKGTKSITAILMNVVTPCVLVNAYQIDYSKDILKDILISFGGSTLLHIIFIAVAYLVFGWGKRDDRKRVHIFTTIYSNCGFFGIPLLAASLGQKGVLFGSAYLVLLNVLSWTQGMFIYCENMEIISFKNIIKNAGVVGSIVAMILFFAHIKITGPVKSVIDYMASMNTPLAMILIGTYLAKTNLLEGFKNVSLYIVVALRLIVLPIVSIFAMKLLGISTTIATALIITASCPCAALSAIFADKFGLDSGYPSQIVSITTVLSILTIPVMAYISAMVIG